jgi:hypothetical protein
MKKAFPRRGVAFFASLVSRRVLADQSLDDIDFKTFRGHNRQRKAFSDLSAQSR